MHFLSSSSIIFFSLSFGSWASDSPFSLFPVVRGIVFRVRVLILFGLMAESGGGLTESGGSVERSKTGVGGGGSGRSRM